MEAQGLSSNRLLAILAAILCLFSIVETAIPQLQMCLMGGQLLVGNGIAKALLLAIVLLGYILRPRFLHPEISMFPWFLCIGFLVFEAAYLTVARETSITGVLLSYSSYYLILLIGPALIALENSVPEQLIVRFTIFLFLISALIGAAQYWTGQPILYTESADGSFTLVLGEFYGEMRAFSLFTSALSFGMFCAFCGALGVAIIRTLPIKGALLFTASAVACYCTLTRLCYLVFVCACICSFVLSFGKKPTRTLWHPLLYFFLGLLVIWRGLHSLASGDSSLQDSASLLDRIFQWGYFSNVLLSSSFVGQLFGLGIVQSEKLSPTLPMVIDNSYLALLLHTGLIGLLIFGFLMWKMWLYLRREALDTQQPLVIAAASLWATLPCAGIFNIVFSTYGAVFALVVLCAKQNSGRNNAITASVD